MAQWADGAKRPDYDRTREPLEVFALNEKFQRATGSIPYTSLQWCRRYYESGTFSMTVPEDVYDPSWAYIYTDSRYETGVIQKVEFSDTAHTPDGRDTVTVSGFFLEELLNSITFLDEQPVTVENKIWHPYKKASWRKLDSFPDVYQDPMGDYYYEDESGQVVSADDGRVVSTDGLTKIDYHNPGRIGAYWNVDESENLYRDTYNYLVANDGTTLYRKSPISDEPDSYDVDFITDKSDVFYHDQYGQLCIAFGISEQDVNGGFWTSSRRWSDENGEWEIQKVTVKGPWQRTGTFDTTTENDPVDTCYKWVRMFCGNEMAYAETDLSGAPRAIDPSFQLLGDLVHGVLQSEGMSYRVEYNFLNDGFLFSVWQGKNRTQGDLSEEFPQKAGTAAKARAVSVLDAGSSAALPSGYTQLEYIQSSGTQYIDTGFKPDQDTRLVMDVQILGAMPTHQWIYGTRIASESQSFGFFWNQVSETFGACYGNAQSDIDSSVAMTDRLQIDHNKGNISFNGTTHTFPSDTFTAPVNLALLARNTNGNIECFTSCKLYSCAIYNGSEQARGFVPSKRDSDGAVGLYDTIGQSFYANAGTGTFTAGPEVKAPASLQYLPNSTSATGSTPETDGYVGDQVAVAQYGFIRDDAEFTAWNTVQDGSGMSYAPGNMYTLTGSGDVLYAQWQENEEPEPEPEPTPEGGKAPWAVFSDTWGTIYDYTASRDSSNYRNTCYVLYDYDEPDSFDADGVPESQTMMTTGETLLDITGWTVSIPHHKEQGWLVAKVGDDDEPIVETYLDLRDTKPAVDNLWSKEGTSKTYDNADGNRADAEEEAKAAAAELVSTEEDGTMPNFEQVYATFKDSLLQQGVEYLMRSYPVITNLDTGAVDTVGYMVDWDLGDKVEFGVSKVGLAMQARIVAVDEVYESGKSEIRIEIGESRLGPMDKARLLK